MRSRFNGELEGCTFRSQLVVIVFFIWTFLRIFSKIFRWPCKFKEIGLYSREQQDRVRV